MACERHALYGRIDDWVRGIPPGRVASYGQIGAFVGCGPRQVGRAMATLPPGADVPWHRVVNSRGALSTRTAGDGHLLQRHRLEAEGVVFDGRGTIDLGHYGWSPGGAGHP